MIGIVVVTHGRLAEELILATEHVVGDLTQVRTLCVGADDDLEAARALVREAIEAVDGGDGVVVVTDMFGGTPANLAISLMRRGRVEVLAGANLPMMIKLAEARETAGLVDAVQAAMESGRKYIAIASRVLDGDG